MWLTIWGADCCVHTEVLLGSTYQYWGSMSLIFPSNSEADDSELLKHLENMFYVHDDVYCCVMKFRIYILYPISYIKLKEFVENCYLFININADDGLFMLKCFIQSQLFVAAF